MKSSVSLISPAILTLMLSAALSACSSWSSKPEETVSVQQPKPRSGTIVHAESDAATSRHSAAAQSIKASHPRTYVVKRGDTLWDIASLYLNDPWYWPEIWYDNPQVENPHLIYPGDVLTLVYVDGMPRIMVGKQVHAIGEVAPLPVVKLSPSKRRETLEASIQTIPGDAIRQFLSKPRVVSKEELDNAPYIVSSDDDHLILGQGDRVYVRGEIDKERVRYAVYRPGAELIDPASGEILGYEGIYAGEVHISKYGDPATGKLTFTEREVLLGDRLLPTDKSKIDNLYFPRLPDRKITGMIILLPDALFGVAKLQIAVINQGDRDGLEVGNLLATYTAGEHIKDKYAHTGETEEIELPEERSGLMMIFRTFDHVSYGLILESTRVIHNHDIVKTPG
jgi:LysM repeat protein